MEKKIDMKKITFRNETPADYRAVENLTREAFWNVYKPGCDEHFILHNFRTRCEFVPELDIIMEEEGILVGHVMFARAEIKLNNSKTLPIMTFGPISIASDFKHKGYGTVLLRYAMEKAKKMDCGALAITGNIEELVPSFLDEVKNCGGGSFKEPDGYFIDSKEAEEFDRHFPIKERLSLPGQIFG